MITKKKSKLSYYSIPKRERKYYTCKWYDCGTGAGECDGAACLNLRKQHLCPDYKADFE